MYAGKDVVDTCEGVRRGRRVLLGLAPVPVVVVLPLPVVALPVVALAAFAVEPASCSAVTSLAVPGRDGVLFVDERERMVENPCRTAEDRRAHMSIAIAESVTATTTTGISSPVSVLACHDESSSHVPISWE